MTEQDVIDKVKAIESQVRALNAERSALLSDAAAAGSEFKPGDVVEYEHGKQRRKGRVERIDGSLSRNDKLQATVMVWPIKADGSVGDKLIGFPAFYLRGLRKAEPKQGTP